MEVEAAGREEAGSARRGIIEWVHRGCSVRGGRTGRGGACPGDGAAMEEGGMVAEEVGIEEMEMEEVEVAAVLVGAPTK